MPKKPRSSVDWRSSALLSDLFVRHEFSPYVSQRSKTGKPMNTKMNTVRITYPELLTCNKTLVRRGHDSPLYKLLNLTIYHVT